MARLTLLLRARPLTASRLFSSTARRRDVVQLPQPNALPPRTPPNYQANRRNDLLALQWPAPPRTILVMKKEDTPHVTAALVELAQHIQTSYPGVRILLEPAVARAVHASLPAPVYALPPQHADQASVLTEHVDLIATLGGDGTILHAASLFAAARRVPPILAFSMGTLGFLGEWKFAEYKRAFREVYMSGASLEQRMDRAAVNGGGGGGAVAAPSPQHDDDPWAMDRGKFMGANRQARILLRQRLKVSVHPPSSSTSTPTALDTASPSLSSPLRTPLYALNEVILHRGSAPHLTNISITVNGRHLTDAIADGLIIASPTGSTAYSLSAGGSIVHPLVPALLLTPICPRSLSFRPLVLPAAAEVRLRVSEQNRSKGVDVSVDGVRISGGEGAGCGEGEGGLPRGWEVRVQGEDVGLLGEGECLGGVPSVVRGTMGAERGEDHWVGGLNGLLKFNYPFGEGV